MSYLCAKALKINSWGGSQEQMISKQPFPGDWQWTCMKNVVRFCDSKSSTVAVLIVSLSGRLLSCQCFKCTFQGRHAFLWSCLWQAKGKARASSPNEPRLTRLLHSWTLWWYFFAGFPTQNSAIACKGGFESNVGLRKAIMQCRM